MVLGLSVSSLVIAILTILIGILILAFPKLLRWMVGLYLIVIGLVELIMLLVA